VTTNCHGAICLSVTADRAYLPHVATMLASALAVPAQPRLSVQLLHGGDLHDRDLAPLRARLARAGGALQSHAIDRRRVSGLSDAHFSRTAWYRILLPDVLPDHPRALHVDGDALVLASLGELWRTDLGRAPFAAVENPLYPWMPAAWERLGLPEGTAYPNSGVMVLDLDHLRAVDAPARLLAYGARHPHHRWPEQDALAATFPGEWAPLPPRWNAQTTVWDLPPRLLPWTRAEIATARRRPAIRHFSGPIKPWDGWGRGAELASYARHRRSAGYPLARRPRRTRLSRLSAAAPVAFKRRLMLRAIHHHERRATCA
jgi:lipopolysaccharide biosynthesis glycosyltransferase